MGWIRWRRSRGAWIRWAAAAVADGLGGPMMGSPGFFFFVLFCFLINRGGQLVHLIKSLIYRDLLGEADGRAHLGKLLLTASEKKNL